MLMYLIIILELAFLYAAFWYIYLREPKPRKIVGNPWGCYENTSSAKQFTAFGADPTLPALIDKRPGKHVWQVQQPAPAYAKSTLPTQSTPEEQAKAIIGFFSNLKDSVKGLSVKLP